jgi:uncharacterized protein YkwD
MVITIKHRAFILTALLLWTSFALVPGVPNPPDAEMLSEKTRMIETHILILTNRTREERDLKPLKREGLLDQIARSHSLDMIERDFFDHVNPDGKDPTQRAKDRGYKLKKFLNDHTYIEQVGENIAKMPTGLVLYRGYVEDTPEEIAKALMKSWMARPGHRANILKYYYTHIGIGVAFDGKYYVATQNFH